MKEWFNVVKIKKDLKKREKTLQKDINSLNEREANLQKKIDEVGVRENKLNEILNGENKEAKIKVLIYEIKKNIESNRDLDKNLFKLLEVSTFYNHQLVINWIKHEIHGYPSSNSIPSYRKLIYRTKKGSFALGTTPFTHPLAYFLKYLDYSNDLANLEFQHKENLMSFRILISLKEMTKVVYGVKSIIYQYLTLLDNQENIENQLPNLFKSVYPNFSELFEPILSIKNLPDDFYTTLQTEINIAFQNGLYPVVQILIRKFLENLLIDILRRKYTMKEVDMFFDTGRGKFHDFQILLRNISEHLDDFNGVPAQFNKDLLHKIEIFRKKGNSSAHSIELNVDKSEMLADVQQADYIIKILVKVFESLK